MLNKFLEHIELEKRYSPHTLTSYSKDLADFLQFYTETEGSEELWKADKKVIRNFIISLSEKQIAKRSINRKLSTLRSYFLFMLKIGEIEVSPMESIQSLKFYAEKQIAFSQEEMSDFQNLMPNTESTLLPQLIIETLYQTGMRKAELCNLRNDHVDLENGELRIIGKGNKVRLIPISHELAEKLRTYQKKQEATDTKRNMLFCK